MSAIAGILDLPFDSQVLDTMLATMMFLQKGVPFIYQGQEIETVNPYSENIEDYDLSKIFAELKEKMKELENKS